MSIDAQIISNPDFKNIDKKHAMTIVYQFLFIWLLFNTLGMDQIVFFVAFRDIT